MYYQCQKVFLCIPYCSIFENRLHKYFSYIHLDKNYEKFSYSKPLCMFIYLSNIFFNSSIKVFTSLNSLYTDANLTYATESKSFNLFITISPIAELLISFSSLLKIVFSISSTN